MAHTAGGGLFCNTRGATSHSMLGTGPGGAGSASVGGAVLLQSRSASSQCRADFREARDEVVDLLHL